jgi:hypothetical protein
MLLVIHVENHLDIPLGAYAGFPSRRDVAQAGVSVP